MRVTCGDNAGNNKGRDGAEAEEDADNAKLAAEEDGTVSRGTGE